MNYNYSETICYCILWACLTMDFPKMQLDPNLTKKQFQWPQQRQFITNEVLWEVKSCEFELKICRSKIVVVTKQNTSQMKRQL